MQFEKWQALGNDYVIVEERELPFELTPERVRRSARRTPGSARTACCCCARATRRGLVAEVRIYNPDGSEAELSGNGVRQAVMYLRRSGWVDDDSFSVLTAAGQIHPRIEGELCTWASTGAARADDFPRGRRRHAGAPPAATSPSSSCRSATRSARSRPPRSSRRSTWSATGQPIESHELFPRRTNVSFWRRTGDAAIRARIFERGVGETMSSGTGATRRRRRRRAARGHEPGDGRARRRGAGVEVGEDLRRDPDRLGPPRLRGNAQR